MSVAAEVVSADGSVRSLGADEPAVVPSGDVVLVVRGAGGSEVRLDGRVRQAAVAGGALLVPVDLTRSTGFHHVHVAPGHDFWFGSEDAKLGLDGLELMLAYLREEGRAWSGQLLFADGSILRDPHVVYGWLDHFADRLLLAAGRVVSKPHQGSVAVPHTSDRDARRVDVPATVRLLRKRPAEFLEESVHGVISSGGQRYMPRRVVVRRKRSTVDTGPNRRVVWTLAQVARMSAEVLRGTPPAAERARCVAWKTASERLLDDAALAGLSRRARAQTPPDSRYAIEVTDVDYGTVHDVCMALLSAFGFALGRDALPTYSYVAYSDQIYQSFVAYTVAEALDLKPTAATLGLRQPAFTSDQWDLIVNAVPGPGVVRTWRSYSGSPDSLRPDLTLRRRASGAVVLADAKYRQRGLRASEDSRVEVMAYLQAYGAGAAIIFYPPDPPSALEVHRVEALGHKLIEVPVSPVAGLPAFLRATLPALLDELEAPPRWSG